MSNPEGVRRKTEEYDIRFTQDLHLFEMYRDDHARDIQIAYAKDGRDHIVKGYPLDWVVEQLLVQVPVNRADIALVTQYLNHFLQEIELDIRFDQDCNVFVDGVEVIHTGAREHFVSAKAAHDEMLVAAAHRLAELGTQLIQNGHEPEMIKAVLTADIVVNGVDNVLVAQLLNSDLAELGIDIQFDKYLIVIK